MPHHQKLERSLVASTDHALDAVDLARRGNCRQAVKWLGVAQKELLRAADSWPGGGLPIRLKPHVVVLEQASDEVVRRCRRSFGEKKRRRR
jgi:hypothetical protein